MSRYIGAIDQGTTSTRFIVFDRAGDAIAAAQTEHQQIYPQPGWVEHDPLPRRRPDPRSRAGVGPLRRSGSPRSPRHPSQPR